MYEISHKQARYLLTKALDSRVSGDSHFPQEQWTALQQHLEGCQECREYHQKMVILEKNLRNGLHRRWYAAEGPGDGLSLHVQTSRIRRRQKNGLLLGSGVVVLAIFLLIVLAGRRAPVPVTGGIQASVTHLPTTPPTVDPAALFHGWILFTSPDTGNQEVYLYQSNENSALDELVNLTNNPANDTAPVWSPDGGWVAFLSDRTGKNEVYMVSVAGTGLTQLTNNPDIDWQGPLTWSPGGEWIALIGRPKKWEGTPFVYIITVFAKYAEMIETTADASGLLSFFQDPNGPSFLVYKTGQGINQFFRFDFYSNSFQSLTATDDYQNGFEPANDGAFVYLPLHDSDEFVYIARKKGEEAGEPLQIRQVTIPKESETLTYEVLASGQAGSMRGLSIVPGNTSLAALVNPQNNGCWQLKIFDILGARHMNQTIDGLCVDGDLNNSQWSADGHWVLLQAHKPGEKETALYSVRIISRGETEASVLYQKLLDRVKVTGPLLIQPIGNLGGNPSLK